MRLVVRDAGRGQLALQRRLRTHRRQHEFSAMKVLQALPGNNDLGRG